MVTFFIFSWAQFVAHANCLPLFPFSDILNHTDIPFSFYFTDKRQWIAIGVLSLILFIVILLFIIL